MYDYKKQFPKDDEYRQRFVAEASEFYRQKMMELIDNDPKRRHELRGYVPGLELPGHLMYRIGTIQSHDNHRLYEFLIEYDTDTPTEGIYYGCRGITINGNNHDEEIEHFREDWNYVKAELCTILNNTFPYKDFSHRFKLTDNANTNTYWLFWITLNEDEDIKKVGVCATQIIQNVFQRYLNGEEFTRTKMPNKQLTDSVIFTKNTYLELCNCFANEENTLNIVDEFLHKLEMSNLIVQDSNYERAWRSVLPNIDFACLLGGFAKYNHNHGYYTLENGRGTRKTKNIPWANFTKVFLSKEGNVFNTDYIKNQYNNAIKYGTKYEEWYQKIEELFRD